MKWQAHLSRLSLSSSNVVSHAAVQKNLRHAFYCVQLQVIPQKQIEEPTVLSSIFKLGLKKVISFSLTGMHSTVFSYRLFHKNNSKGQQYCRQYLNSVEKGDLVFLDWSFISFLIGLQHDVIHPPDPFGLPLEYSILPQELKKVGKYDTCQKSKTFLEKTLCIMM